MNNNLKHTWLNTILAALTSIMLIAIVTNINKYGSLSKGIFIMLNLVIVIVVLGLILISVKINNTKRLRVKTISTFGLIVGFSLSAYGVYLINIVDKNVKNITTESDSIKYTASFVVYDSLIDDVSQLADKTMGVIESEEFIEGSILPKDELKKLKYDDVKLKSYQSYTQLISALVKDEVDFISLPQNYRSLYSTNEQVEPFLEKIKPVHTFSGKYKNISKVSGSNIDVTEVPFTVLLMGNDGGRTDTLMLASVNPKAMQVTLTSIARDSYVPIACYPGQSRDKINHARTINRDCTIKTVENILDISIDFFVEINFQGVVDLVDSLGTLTIDSPAAFYGNIETEEGGGVFIPKGVSELNGHQVLAFARERKSFLSGDFQRQKNQQQIIDVMLSKVIETRDVNKVVNLIKATGQNVETNMSLPQLIDLMNLGIMKMESTFLNNSEIFTIYGSRVTGRGAMWYSAEYGQEIYYYILYDGSINDAKAFISMNTRADGILEIPTGFNYKITDEYTPPIFGLDEYYETIDEGIINSDPRPEPEEPDDTPIGTVGDIEIIDFSGSILSELQQFADNNELILVLEQSEQVSEDTGLIGNTYVVDNNAGIFLNSGDTLNAKVVKYVKEASEVLPEDPEKNPDADPDTNKDDKPEG